LNVDFVSFGRQRLIKKTRHHAHLPNVGGAALARLHIGIIVSQKETMMPLPAPDCVNTLRPSKPRCSLKIGTKPRPTRRTSVRKPGGNQILVTLEYTAILASSRALELQTPYVFLHLNDDI
jgi:hypothetical protein